MILEEPIETESGPTMPARLPARYDRAQLREQLRILIQWKLDNGATLSEIARESGVQQPRLFDFMRPADDHRRRESFRAENIEKLLTYFGTNLRRPDIEA